MPTRLIRFGVGVCLALWLAFSFGPSAEAVVAQQLGNVFLPAPRTFRQHLTRARKALAEERYGDAVLELGALLSRSPTNPEDPREGPQDFFMAAAESTGAQTSLKSEAQRLLGSMPRKGLELYELQFGADARALLEEAVRLADLDILNEVVRKYFHTQAGYEAAVLLGRLHLDRGQPLAAALCFQRVIDAPAAASQYDPELSVLLAACWFYSDRPQRAIETLAPLQRRFPRVQLRIGEHETEALPASEHALAWLERHFQTGPSSSRGASQWLLHRGDATRNAAADGGMPLTNLRWRVTTATDPTDEALLRDIQSSHLNQSFCSVPSISPLAVDDVILMRTPDRLLAIDFASGKRIWEYPWWDASYPSVTFRRRGSTHNQEVAQRKEELRQRLWYDAPYGQVSSDGEAVYLLDDLRFAQTRRNLSPWLPPGGGRRASPDWPQQHNQLVALDLARQGSLKWMVGGESGLDEPKLAGAFFLGAPLPLLGQLYVLAEINGEIRLLVLDDQSGRQLWSQQLAHVDSLTILHNQRRRLAGASPSYGDGVLICPTSAGAVVAVDLASRALLWGYQYAPVRREMNPLGIPNAFPSQSPGSNRWTDATVTIANGAVVLTPVETNKLFCLDLLTGTPRWPPLAPERDLGDSQFVACVHDDNLILVGQHAIKAVRMSDGGPAWDEVLELNDAHGEMPSGRGFRSGRFYYLPTTTSHLLKIDLASGTLVERAETEQVLGNLLCYKDEVISQGTDYLTTFHQIEPLRERVAERLEASPQDAWALARRGELLIHDGQLRPAMDSLRRAYELQSDDVAVRALLVKTLLAALRQDFVEHQSLAVELEQLIDRPGQRLEYLRLMATGLHSTGKLAEAAQQYLELADLVVSEIGDQGLEAIATVQIDEDGTARLDRWLQARLGGLLAVADTAIRTELDEEVDRRWRQIQGGSTSQLEKFLAMFGAIPASTAARIEVADRLAAQDRCLEAELLLSQLARQASPQDALIAAVRVAARLRDEGKPEAAAVFYRMLARNWAHVEGPDGRSGTQLLAAVAAEPSLQEALAEPPDWPVGRIEESTAAGRSDQIYRRVIPIPIRRSKATSNDYTVAFDGGSNGSIFVRDGQGQIVSRASVSSGRVYYQNEFGVNYAEFNGNLLVSVLADNVIAMDMFRSQASDDDVLLWRDQFAQSMADPRRQGGSKGKRARNNPFDRIHRDFYFVQDGSGQPVGTLGPVNDHGIVFLKSRTLVCVDPTSGQQLWDRKNIARGTDVFGDDEYVFLVPPGDTTATVLSAIDGTRIAERRVPPRERRWTTQGRLILAWDNAGDRLQLQLYDAWTESGVWTERYADGARGTLLTSSVAVMEPGGRFQIRSLYTEEVEVDAQLEPEDALEGIYVLSSKSQYLLATDRLTAEDSRQRIRVSTIAGGLPAPRITGSLYAFARSSGKQLWQSPARIENFGLALYQPGELPTLWFLRQVSTSRSRRGPSQSEKTSVLCLDRRSGRLLLMRDDIATRATSYAIRANPDTQTVRLHLPGLTFDLQFTDEPVPPEPPARAGQTSG